MTMASISQAGAYLISTELINVLHCNRSSRRDYCELGRFALC